MYRLTPLGLRLLLLLPLLNAGPVNAEQDADPELEALLVLLDEETELATQNKMNADYVPGMVSVLHGEALQGYGVTTVVEALNQVAGFYTTHGNNGEDVTIVRGVGASLNARNLKIMLNGVALNRPVDASAEWALRLPISQVERIEVIRGPGSALYGEFAFAGVVNIITRQDNNVGVRLASHNYRQGDLLVDRSFDNGTRLSVNLSAWGQDDSGGQTEKDNFARRGLGHSPGDIYDNEQGQVLLAAVERQGYQLQLQHAQVERGGWYGRNAAMPQDLDPRIETVTGIDLKKNWALTPGLNLDLSFSRLQTELEHAAYLPIPAGIALQGAQPLLVDNFRQDGNQDTSERAGLGLHWSATTAHTLFLEFNWVRSRVDSAFVRRFELDQPAVYGNAEQTLVLAGSERTLRSVTLQDQWQLNDSLELTLGARYDHYDDWGSNTSPRAAAVWRLSDQHIVKFQYAEAFRPPTMEEQYPGPLSFPGTIFNPLQEERLRSHELAYIHHSAGFSFRSTLFQTQVRDLIEFYIKPGQPPVWRNRGDIDTEGLELEWQQSINRDWEWFANLSYVSAKDHLDSDEKLMGAVDWLANLGMTWHQNSNTSHALRLRYVGAQEDWELQTIVQPPARFDDYYLADYTFNVKEIMEIAGLGLSAGVKNITDQKYSTVAVPAQYPMGLPHGERTAWMQLEYSF